MTATPQTIRRLVIAPPTVTTVDVLEVHSGLVLVPDNAPLYARKAIEKIGVCFCRELHTDCRPYHARNTSSTVGQRLAYAWHDRWFLRTNGNTALPLVGACCLEVREDNHGYMMTWAWIHPYFRRTGLLTEAWPRFVERCGAFSLLGPLSPAMKAFVESRNVQHHEVI